MSIVESEDVLSGKARLEGRRISVLQIADRVLTHGQSPEYVADQFDVTLAETPEPLAYYYDNVDEMSDIRERQREFETKLEGRATPTPGR